MWHSSERVECELFSNGLCHEMYGLNGSDVTNVLFYSLYLSVVFCHSSVSSSWLVLHVMRLAKTFWKYFNVLQSFRPSWWESASWFQWYKFTGKLSETHQMFQSHFEEKPTLLDLGWLLVHMRLNSFVALLAAFLSPPLFFFLYDCQHFCFSPILEIFHSFLCSLARE